MNEPSERLNKYLAFHLGISRREADEEISRGAVFVNGAPASLGSRYTPGDSVLFNGKPVAERGDYTYLILHKPAGYVSSKRQQGDSPTIYSLLPQEYQHLKSVGRLDRESSGILLFTDDGDFAHRMTHPSFVKVKVYEAILDLPLEPLHQQMISDIGVQLEDGRSQLTLERLDDDRKKWRITMHEGRNRQIRRTFMALGYSVVSLHRLSFGNYALGDIPVGSYVKTDMH